MDKKPLNSWSRAKKRRKFVSVKEKREREYAKHFEWNHFNKYKLFWLSDNKTLGEEEANEKLRNEEEADEMEVREEEAGRGKKNSEQTLPHINYDEERRRFRRRKNMP